MRFATRLILGAATLAGLFVFCLAGIFAHALAAPVEIGEFVFLAQRSGGQPGLRKVSSGKSELQPEAAQISQRLNALVSPAVQLATGAEVLAEEANWKNAYAPIAALGKSGKCTKFATVDYTPTARWVTVRFTYLPDGSVVNPKVSDSSKPVTDLEREHQRLEQIKKTLLAQFKKCPKLVPIPSLPSSGVEAQYQLWIKEPAAGGKKATAPMSPVQNQDNGGQVKGRVVNTK